MSIYLTSLAAILLAPLFITLMIRVIRYRRKNKVSLATNVDSDLEKRVRAHGNFTENVPLFLILAALNELQNANASALGSLLLLFVIGRYCHAISISKTQFKLRTVGMIFTIFPTIAITILLMLTVISNYNHV